MPLPVLAVVGVLVGGAGGWVATMPEPERISLLQTVARQVEKGAAVISREPRPYRHFSGCNDARAEGYESIARNEPSYRPEMDGDGDGIACEPYIP